MRLLLQSNKACKDETQCHRALQPKYSILLIVNKNAVQYIYGRHCKGNIYPLPVGFLQLVSIYLLISKPFAQ